MRPGPTPGPFGIHPAGSRRGEAGNRAHRSPHPLRRHGALRGVRGCSTASRHRSAGVCQRVTVTATPIGSDLSRSDARPSDRRRCSGSAPSNVQRMRSSSTTPGTTGAGTPCGNRRSRSTSSGWSVEMRIPLSQLRFPSADKQTWGLNVERFIRRKNETGWLEMVPKNETGRASRMVHLAGLDGLKPLRRLELLPYTAGRAEYVAPASHGQSVQRRLARVRIRRARHEVRADQQPDDRRDGESRLRPGRSRSGRRQSQRIRDLLRGEAARSSSKARKSSTTSDAAARTATGASTTRSRRSSTRGASAARRSCTPTPSSPIRRRPRRSSAPRSSPARRAAAGASACSRR